MAEDDQMAQDANAAPAAEGAPADAAADAVHAAAAQAETDAAETAAIDQAEDAPASAASQAAAPSPDHLSRFVGEAVEEAVEEAIAVDPAAASVARALTGVVTANKANKTITVRVDRRVKHPVYGKFIRRSTKLAAHDEHNACQLGDTVTIVESRPISKTKSWRLGAIVERAGV